MRGSVFSLLFDGTRTVYSEVSLFFFFFFFSSPRGGWVGSAEKVWVGLAVGRVGRQFVILPKSVFNIYKSQLCI